MKLIPMMSGDLIEDGVWIDVPHPLIEDEKLFKDAAKTLPCRVRVRSTQSTSYKTAQRQRITKSQGRITRAKPGERDALQASEMADSAIQWFADVLTGTENLDVEKTGVVIPTREESLALAAEPEAGWLVDFVINTSSENKNYGLPANPPKDGGTAES